MRNTVALLILVFFLSAAPAAQEEEPVLPKDDEDFAVYWDRDFDLILEYKQGDERVNRDRAAELGVLETKIEAVRLEIAELEERRMALDNAYSTESLLRELLDLEVGSAAEARAMLDEMILDARIRLGDLEVKFQRAVRRTQKP